MNPSSENQAHTEENSTELLGRQELAGQMTQDVREWNFFPLEHLQGGTTFDELQHGEYAEPGRPYYVGVVEQSQSAKNETAVYKKFTKEVDPSNGSENEILFLRELAPWIVSQTRQTMPRLRFPEYYQGSVERHSLLQQYVEGRVSGNVHSVEPGVLTEEDIHDIATFCQSIQGIDLPSLNRALPSMQLNKLREREVYHQKYMYDLPLRGPALETVLGSDVMHDLETLLQSQQTQELYRDTGPVFAAGDINPANIIKTEDDSLYLIDWERISQTNNPALDYGFLFTTLFKEPQLQEYMFSLVNDKNQHIPHFREHFRLDFLFNRGTGELGHWIGQAAEYNTPESSLAIERLKGLILDALYQQGLWSQTKTISSNQTMPRAA